MCSMLLYESLGFELGRSEGYKSSSPLNECSDCSRHSGMQSSTGSQALICYVNLEVLFDASSFIFQISLLKDIKLSIQRHKIMVWIKVLDCESIR